MEEGLHIGVLKEDTDELIALLTVDSPTDIPFVVGEAIEKDGYKIIVTQDELLFEEYVEDEEETNEPSVTIEIDAELLEKDIKECIKNNIKRYMKVTY